MKKNESDFNVYNFKMFDMKDKVEIQIHDKSVVSLKEGVKVKKKKDVHSLSEEEYLKYKEEQERQKEKYLRNKKTHMYRMIETNISSTRQSCFFITLTFDPKKFNSDISNMQEINKMFKYFIRNANTWTLKKFNKKYENAGNQRVIKYICAPELHKDNRKVHFHILLMFDQPTYLKVSDVKKWWTVKGEELGMINVQCINSMRNDKGEDVDIQYVANYITKYITKDLELWHKMGMKPIKMSKNLKKPNEIKFNFDLRKPQNLDRKNQMKDILLKNNGFKYFQYDQNGEKNETVRCYLTRKEVEKIPELRFLLTLK